MADKGIIDIGTGVYTNKEASIILDMPVRKVGQWIRRYWEMDFLDDYSKNGDGYTLGEGRERVFNFYTLIELITVATFRELDVSFQK